MDSIAGKVLGVSDKSLYLFDNIKAVSWPLVVLDIAIVSILFYWGYLFLRETRAMRILYGLLLLVVLMAAGRLFNLILLNWILRYLMTMLVVAIPVVFQPELRSFLEKLGRPKFLKELSSYKDQKSRLIDETVDAILYLSRQKVGGLIVFQRQTGLREYIEKGIELEAKVSKDLITSIFTPKSPLHDGAVIVAGDKIVSAKSILPVAEIQNSELGTRHRAGIGISETSDAVCVIVSEETGSISLAVGGKIEKRISEEKLRNRLSGLLYSRK